MKPNKPKVATLDEVSITRDGEYAYIEFLDKTIGSVSLKIGQNITSMSDSDILALHNSLLNRMYEFRKQSEYIAAEVPPGKPQIRYESRSDQWVPEGDVLRCLIEDEGTEFETTIRIDDHELSLEEFGRLLLVYNGWGMRIVFVPDDEIDKTPKIEMKSAIKKSNSKKVAPLKQFLGKWRIVWMENWDQDYVDMEEPGFISFESKKNGEFHFGNVHASIDCQLSEFANEQRLEFSWVGHDEMDEVSGRGWVSLKNDGTLSGHIFIHGGENSSFSATKFKSLKNNKIN